MSGPMNVFVYEYFSGGGSPAGDLPDGLATEALGMLWALLADFRALDAVRTVTALDPRFEEQIRLLSRKTLPADDVVRVSPDARDTIFLSLLNRCDAALLVAPETEGILSRLSSQVENAGIPLLGSSAAAAAVAGDKEACDSFALQTCRQWIPALRDSMTRKGWRKRKGSRWFSNRPTVLQVRAFALWAGVRIYRKPLPEYAGSRPVIVF